MGNLNLEAHLPHTTSLTAICLLCNVSNSPPHCCVPSGWSWCAVGWFGLSCSGWRWTSRLRRPCRSPWPASLPHSSASCTRASPSRSGARDPSRTGTGCWSRCTGQDRAPLPQTYLHERMNADPQSHPAHRRVLGVQVRAAASSQPLSARMLPQNCIKLLTRHINYVMPTGVNTPSALLQNIEDGVGKNSPVCPIPNSKEPKISKFKENFLLLHARSLTSWCHYARCPAHSDVIDEWNAPLLVLIAAARARDSPARQLLQRGSASSACVVIASEEPPANQRRGFLLEDNGRNINTINDSDWSWALYLQHKGLVWCWRYQYKTQNPHINTFVCLLSSRNTFFG